MTKKMYIMMILCLTLCLIFGLDSYASSSSEIENYYNEYGSSYDSGLMAPNVYSSENFVDVSRGDVIISEKDFVIKGRNGFDIPIIRKYNPNYKLGIVREGDSLTANNIPQSYGYYYYNTTTNDRILIGFANEFDAFKYRNGFAGYNHADFRPDTSTNAQYYFIDSIYCEDGECEYERDTSSDMVIIYTTYYRELYIEETDYGDQYISLDSNWVVLKPGMFMWDFWVDSPNYEYVYTFQDIYGNVISSYITYRKVNGIFIPTVGLCYDQHRDYSFSFVDSNNMEITATHPKGFSYNFVIESGDGIKYYFYASTYNNFALKAFEDRYGNCFLYNITSGFAQSYTYTDCNTGIVYEVSQNGITKTLNNNSVDLVAYNYIRTNSTSDTTNDYGCDDKISLTVIKNDNVDVDISQSDNRVTYNITQRIANSTLYHTLYPSDNDYMRIHYGIDSIQYPNGLKKLYDYDAINTYRYYPSYARDVYGGYIYNKAEFTFETEFDRYSQTYNVTDTVVFFPYTSKKENYSFDEYGRKVSYKISGSGTYYLYNYSYSCRCYDVPPNYILEKNYVNYTNPSVSTEYEYDEHHLPITTYIDGEIDTQYTYGSYNIPTQIIQRKDDNTDIKTVNTLTSDGKSIASTAVYENNVLKNKKVYSYNTDGTLATETTHTSANESSTTSYTYAYGTDGSTTVTATTSGITDADGNALDNIVTQTKTDSYGNIVWTKDANGNETTTDYDLLGRVTQITNADNTFVTYAYNDTANTTTYTDAEGNTYRATYNGWGDVLKIHYLDNGTYKLLEEYAYNTENLLRMYKRFRDGTSRDGATYTYDAFGRVLTETVKNADGTTASGTSYGYTDLSDSENRPILKRSAYLWKGANVSLTIDTTTDYLGNEVTQKYTDSSGNVRQFTYTYDYLGNMLTSTAPDNSTESYTYNHLGNVLSYTNQLGNTQSVSYDMANQKVSETDFNGNTTTYTYDKAGRNIKIVNPFDDTQTSTKKLYYDSNGNLIQEQNQISATLYNKVDYDYDVMNRLAFVATHENGAKTDLTQYFYDGNGNVTYMIIPHITIPRSAPEYMSPEDKYVSYTYDALGRCIATGGNLSVPKSYEYDFAGHMTKETKPMGSVVYTYNAYDNVTSVSDATSTTPKNTYTYNVLGQRTSMTDETGTTTYAYDGFGNLTTETKGGIIKTSTYNTMGRRTGFIVKNNGTTILSNSYTYDNAGRLLSVTSNGKTMSYTYDANGNVLTENGTDIQTSYAYNNANLVTEKTDTKSGNIIDKSYNIQYNLMGNRTRVTDLTTNHNVFYNYTQDGRLVYELKKGANNKISEISYDYDTVGNMTNRCVYYANSNEIYDYDFVYGNYNQLEYTTVEYDDFTNISEYTIQYEYDANGNMIEKTSFDEDYLIESLDTYTFDIFGRMTQSTNDGIATTYTYDGDNLRASKTTNGVTTNHILDGMNVVADITGSTTNSYSRGLSLYASKKGTQTFSYTTNIHGDISAEIDSQNAIKRDYYDNYGNIITEQITDMPFGYTGEYSDTETGLIYLRNRYYDPEICRFITEDPIMDGTNWYSYCDGNPVMFVDPWGLSGMPRGEEVYLRDMFNMYKESSSDKISVYDNRVVVNLNSKSQTYYYNTNTHDSVHGNRMNGDKMVVNAVDFAQHFGLVKEKSDYEAKGYSFLYMLETSTPLAAGTTYVSSRLSVKYVDAPNKRIVFEQAMVITTSLWSLPKYEVPAPTVFTRGNVEFTQESMKKRVHLDKFYLSVRTNKEDSYYGQYSTQRTVYDSGKLIIASANFSVMSSGFPVSYEINRQILI